MGNPAYVIGTLGDAASWADDITVKTQYEVSDKTKVGLTFIRTSTQTTFDQPTTYLKNSAGESVFTDGTFNILEASYLGTPFGRTRDIYNLKLDTALGPITTTLSTGLVDMEQYWIQEPGFTPDTTRFGGPGTYLNQPSKEWYVNLQFTAPEVVHQVLTWGGTFTNDSTADTTYNLSNWLDPSSKTGLASQSGGASNTVGLFLQDEIHLRADLTAYLVARVDWWQVYDGYDQSGTLAGRSTASFSPKGALVYQPFAATTLRLSGGHSFTPPSLFQLFSQYIGFGLTINPNPLLDPETAWSWDAAVTQGLWPGAKATVTYFQNFLSDLIYYQYVSPTVLDSVNAGKAESRGVQLELEQRLFTGVRVFGNGTYTESQITSNPAEPASVGKQMEDLPMWLANVGLEGKYGPVSGSLVGRYVSKRYGTDLNTDVVNGVYGSYDPFFTLDAKLLYTFPKYATLSFSVSNITNQRYFTYYQAPGRSWFTDLTLKF
jgi:iron complex outermembrane receptor protein